MLRTLGVILAATALAMGSTVSGELTFDRGQLTLGQMDEMTTVSLGWCASTWETGAPALPIAVVRLVVPPNMKVTGVTADAVETETIPGGLDVNPVQPPRILSDPGPLTYVPPDPKYYTSAYPGRVVTAGHQGSMFGYNVASVFVAPVQYDGVDKSLVFHARVRFTITLEPAELGYLRPGKRSAEAKRRIEAQVASLVLNPQDTAACAP